MSINVEKNLNAAQGMIPVFAVETPAYTHPTSGREIGQDCLVVAATTAGPYSRRLTPAEALSALLRSFPALSGLELSIRSGGTMRRAWCDVPYPQPQG